MPKQKKAKTLHDILNDGVPEELFALFTFDNSISVDRLVVKFNLWARYFYPRFFASNDAVFHKDIDYNNAIVYLGLKKSFTNLGFRGCSKTSRTKLFIAFCIAEDLSHSRKYMKVLSKDGGNSKQVVTDVYNLLIDPRLRLLHPEIFEKTEEKREETMSSFTTATGVKLIADIVGGDQRGQIQDEARPDFIVFDDFETRETLRSAVLTQRIWDNMEEAKDGLAKGGGRIYLGNYLSERGNVHKLVSRESESDIVLNTPIWDDNHVPAWISRYTVADIEELQRTSDNFEGEYLGKPAASRDVIFDRDTLNLLQAKAFIKEIAGQRIFKKYDPSHRYAIGADIAGGVGLDSSTAVIIDFDTIPCQVVATYADNEIKPDTFGDELMRQGDRFGDPLLAPEKNNHGHATIGRLKQIYPIECLYQTPRPDSKAQERQTQSAIEFGWETNAATKPKMLFALAKAIENGHLELNDARLIQEAKSYTRNDLLDPEIDPRLTTRHFDLLIACAIAWQMKDCQQLRRKEESKPWTPPVEETREFEGSYIHGSVPQMNLHDSRFPEPQVSSWEEPSSDIREFEG